MNVDFQRRVDRIAGTLICRFLSWIPGGRTVPEPLPRPEKILVILLSEMGSLVLAWPLFDRIRQTYPEASLFALVFRQNEDVLDALDVVPESNIFSIRNTRLSDLVADSLGLIRDLRKTRIDTVIDCELFSRVSSILSYLSGARLRAGFHRHTQEGLYRGDFINRPVLYNPYVHISQQFLHLVDAIGSSSIPLVKQPVAGERPRLPPMSLRPGELDAFRRRFFGDFPQARSRPIVLLNPGGGLLPIRAWPIDHFASVAENLAQKDYLVGITGLARDKELARVVLNRCPGPKGIDLTGYTRTVRELMLLFHIASLLITNDGGPGHFASITPMPAIILYGPETPALYGSLDHKAVNLFAHLSCSPCLSAYNHRKSPCDGDNVCLQSIPVPIVLKAAYQILLGEDKVAST